MGARFVSVDRETPMLAAIQSPARSRSDPKPDSCRNRKNSRRSRTSGFVINLLLPESATLSACGSFQDPQEVMSVQLAQINTQIGDLQEAVAQKDSTIENLQGDLATAIAEHDSRFTEDQIHALHVPIPIIGPTPAGAVPSASPWASRSRPTWSPPIPSPSPCPRSPLRRKEKSRSNSPPPTTPPSSSSACSSPAPRFLHLCNLWRAPHPGSCTVMGGLPHLAPCFLHPHHPRIRDRLAEVFCLDACRSRVAR